MVLKLKPETIKEWKNLLPITYKVGISSSLIYQQELDRPDVGIVFNMHGQKLKLFDEMRSFLMTLADDGEITESDIEKIEDFNETLEGLEFAAQEAWQFTKSVNHHNWWLDVPGCRCPQMDNRERIGYSGPIYNGDCVWHGLFDKTKTEI